MTIPVRRPPCLRTFFHVLLLTAGIFTSHGALAQTTIDPTTAEFDPSPDHDAIVNGSEVVSRYDLEFYLNGATQPFQTVSLGKPDPQADGKIRVDLTTVLNVLLAPGVVYESVVAAVGPGGVARSAPSNTFMWSVSCEYSVSSSNTTLPASGGSGSISVTSPAGCAWTATTTSPWITITSGSSGTGNGTVAYTTAANTSSSPRTTTVQVAGQSVTISQDGACAFSVSPSSLSLAASAGSASMTVSTTSGCSWTASENHSWISIVSGSSGMGDGAVSIAVTANTGTNPRSGTVTVAGQAVAVSQAGACTYSVSPTSQTLDASGGSVTFTVSAGTGCNWTASETSAWLAVTSGASGSGNGRVTVAADPNTTSSDRTASVVVAGDTVSVTQVRSTIPVAPSNLRITGAQ